MSLVAVSAAVLGSPAPSRGVDPSPTQRLLTAIGRKLDNLQDDVIQSPLTGIERKRLEARMLDVRTDLTALGEPRDPADLAQARALRERLQRISRLLHDRPV